MADYIDREALLDRLKQDGCDCEFILDLVSVPSAMAFPKLRRPMTNADMIRSMNNYELAVFIAKTKAALYRADLPVVAYSTQDMADNLEWLQKSAGGMANENS